jgi:hypothetical protein
MVQIPKYPTFGRWLKQWRGTYFVVRSKGVTFGRWKCVSCFFAYKLRFRVLLYQTTDAATNQTA